MLFNFNCRYLRISLLALLLAVATLHPTIVLAGNDGTSQSRQWQSNPKTYSQVGMASWYGRENEGRRTASGQAFNPSALTAAHKTLPLGTIIKVTNLSTGKAVKVRVNDRGPYVQGRIVDLSAAAGEILKIRKHGVVPVRVEVFSADQKRASNRP